MAQINKPTDYFNTVLYTGNGSTQSITGVNFQPDWVWLKDRDNATNHMLFDSVRGTGKELHSQNTDSETTQANTLTAFGSDGFSLGNNTDVNNSSQNFVAWNWLGANGTASNTDGSITSSVSVNQTAGISIGTFTGTASVGTVGHGLNAVPSMIINRTITSDGKDWMTYHHKNTSAPQTDYLALNSTNATADFEDVWNDTDPTSSLFTIGDSSQNNTGSGTSIFYAFAEKKGFSRFGSFQGNGSNDGSYIHLGFKPAFLIIRRTDDGDNWVMFDNKRNEFNLTDKRLYPNSNAAEATASSVSLDLLSNGFKLRGTDSQINNASGSYIYMAFAEAPFVTSTGIPTTAR